LILLINEQLFGPKPQYRLIGNSELPVTMYAA